MQLIWNEYILLALLQVFPKRALSNLNSPPLSTCSCCSTKANISLKVFLNRKPFKKCTAPLYSGCAAVGGPLCRNHTYASIKN